jgi:hypothetical protein
VSTFPIRSLPAMALGELGANRTIGGVWIFRQRQMKEALLVKSSENLYSLSSHVEEEAFDFFCGGGYGSVSGTP